MITLKFVDQDEFDRANQITSEFLISVGQFPDLGVPTIATFYHLHSSLRNVCPECLTNEHVHLENYSQLWHDGDMICSKCRTYVRLWDAG